MTLCLAWKQEQEIYFASDSRLTNNNDNTSIITDDATKIFKIGVEIYDAIPSEKPNTLEKLLYQTNFGLCFTGSYLNGSLLADTIEEVLSNLQGSPQISDFSIDNLSDIAFVIYKQVSKQLTTINRENGMSEVLLGGYCPINQYFKLYKFSSIIQEGLLDFKKETLDIDKSPYMIGDTAAKSKAGELFLKISKEYSQLHLLREIIKDIDIQTVGGNIQIGAFRPNNFKTYGIIEYSSFQDEYGQLQIKDNFKFRGFSLDFNDNELRKGNINIKKTFLNPFENERESLFKQVFESFNQPK